MQQMSETTLTEAEEMEALFAWYAAGTLPAPEQARVESYLIQHPELKSHLTLAREEQHATVGANEAIRQPAGALQQFRSERAARPVSLLVWMERALDRVGEFVASMEPRRLALAGVAACLLVLAQTGLIGVLMTGRGGGTVYETAAGPAASGTFAMVAFAPGATASGIEKLLRDNGLVITGGPGVDGLYRVRLSTAKLNGDEAAQALTRITARGDIVSYAAPAK